MQARDFFDEPAPEATAEPRRAPPVERSAETPQPPRPPRPAEAAPSVMFHAVSEHEAVVEEAHKPLRRRSRHGSDEAASETPSLQMVETQADAPAVPAVLEDEPPRRSRPRKRRGGEVANEPLKLVETQGGPEGTRPDNQP